MTSANNETVELKPCPFCGSTGDMLTVGGHWVECEICETEGPYGQGENQAAAIEAWNTRAALSTDTKGEVPDDVVERVRWPTTASGQTLVDILVAIDKGVRLGTVDFEIAYDEADGDGEVESAKAAFAGRVARLERVKIADLIEPEHGVADPETVADYEALYTEPPPIIVVDGTLRDGNHRVEVARRKGQEHLLAYVINRSDAPADTDDVETAARRVRGDRR